MAEARTGSSLPSSSAATTRWKYDVFLSFRGPDARKGITVDIRDRLQSRGIKTFMDDPDLQVGETISRALMAAIQQSRFAVVVLSKDYASSPWCLDELVEICKCMGKDSKEDRIFPLFFDVDESEVRYQKKGNYKEAFSGHETSDRYEPERVKDWRVALKKVADISGWNTKNYKTHKKLVDKIVEFLRSKVPPDAVESTNDFQAYEATKEAMDKVMEALTDDKITAVGVHGMGGVGKTTMVKQVAAQARKNGTFNHWIIAAISQSLDLKKVQGTLADLLGVTFVEETEAGRAARLHTEIMKKEKLLIILDNVWERTELSKIGIPDYKELQTCNSKVLVTTRKINVCHAMKITAEHGQVSIPLNLLSEEDSLTLFLSNVGTIPFDSPTFEKVVRRVAGECKGLPIALIAVARALRVEDQEEWENAAQRLEQSQYVNPNHEEDDENAFKCIRLSYDYLKHEDYKSCFLLCCLFPEDHDIKIEDLFRYMIGKRLFRDAETLEEARGIVVSVVKYLKNSSLLLGSVKKGCVKMHDVIRDTALNIARSEDGHRFFVRAGRGLKGWPRGVPEGCTALSLMNNEIHKLPEEELVFSDLQILLLNGNAELSEIPEKMIQYMKEVRVLDLSHTSISVLPQSFSLLTNLQALYLDYCHKLIDISAVKKLKKLEILSMAGCREVKLSREIGHLTNLRILDVDCGTYLITRRRTVKIPSKVISKLRKLEELYMGYCGFVDGGCEALVRGEQTETIGFDEFAGLPNLKTLQVGLLDESSIPENVEATPDWDNFCITIIGRCTDIEVVPAAYKERGHNSRSLFLYGPTVSKLPDWFINAVTMKTEKLEYIRCKGMSDIAMEYDHGRLHKVKHLRVTGNIKDCYVYLTELINTTRRVQTGPLFENLEELHLSQLILLEELCVGEFPLGSLFNLKVLHMDRCFSLTSVSNFVQRLPNLENLVLNWMLRLEYVFGCEAFEPEQPKLREMHLLSIHALKSICNGPAPRAMFHNLKTLTVFNCLLLRSLFASDVAHCLVQLEDLLVERCCLLERVIETVSKDKTVLPNLKNLVLKNLPMLYDPSGAANIECPSLERLLVVDCPKISFSISSDLFKASERRNQLSYSTSASNYFGSRNPVQLNDQQLFRFLRGRCENVTPFNLLI